MKEVKTSEYWGRLKDLDCAGRVVEITTRTFLYYFPTMSSVVRIPKDEKVVKMDVEFRLSNCQGQKAEILSTGNIDELKKKSINIVSILVGKYKLGFVPYKSVLVSCEEKSGYFAVCRFQVAEKNYDPKNVRKMVKKLTSVS